ncbi:MAG: hypothetical protein HWE27_17865 [Gammaproteobacteria bacterium]|nr:hypothetical protein [Gammaproteobacteria bacterium]
MFDTNLPSHSEHNGAQNDFNILFNIQEISSMGEIFYRKMISNSNQRNHLNTFEKMLSLKSRLIAKTKYFLQLYNVWLINQEQWDLIADVQKSYDDLMSKSLSQQDFSLNNLLVIERKVLIALKNASSTFREKDIARKLSAQLASFQVAIDNVALTICEKSIVESNQKSETAE